MGKYEGFSDEELILQLRSGQDDGITDYIMEKYKNLVRKKARTMFLIGGDNDDLMQEGMIGLFKAVRDYQESKEASFYNFADLCISRQIYSAIQASQRKKHIPLNSYISIHSQEIEGMETASYGVENYAVSPEKNPEEIFIDKENVHMLEYELGKRMSSLEQKVLDMYLAGNGYQEIAEQLEKPPKSIDNALQRIKNKLQKILLEIE